MCPHFILTVCLAGLYLLSELLGTIPSVRRSAVYLVVFDALKFLIGGK